MRKTRGGHASQATKLQEKLDILMLDVDTCKAAAKTKSAYAEAFTKCSRNIFFVQINEF